MDHRFGRKAQITGHSAAAFVGFIILVLLLAYLFLLPLVSAVANAAILYLVFLRIRAQLGKHGKLGECVLSLFGAFFLLLLIGNILPLWWITSLGIGTVAFLAFFDWMAR